jgi:hypothetical protein
MTSGTPFVWMNINISRQISPVISAFRISPGDVRALSCARGSLLGSTASAEPPITLEIQNPALHPAPPSMSPPPSASATAIPSVTAAPNSPISRAPL